MKNVYNEAKTEILTEYDLQKGRLVDDILEIFHPASKKIEEVFHYETIATYSNGGVDVKKIVDIEGVSGSDAFTETEEIYVYIPYTEQELELFKKKKEIFELKTWFDNNYRYFAEKLTRFERLGIEDIVEDDIRNKKYATLNDLFVEAELVRTRINALEAETSK